jgi:hypothetical protein
LVGLDQAGGIYVQLNWLSSIKSLHARYGGFLIVRIAVLLSNIQCTIHNYKVSGAWFSKKSDTIVA